VKVYLKRWYDFSNPSSGDKPKRNPSRAEIDKWKKGA